MTTSATQKIGNRHPIIQGPFGGNFSTAQLAAAVSNLGGLGSFGLQAYGSSDIRRIIGELHAATGHPFALNQGRADLAAFYAGQGAPLLPHRTAADLLRELVG